MIHTAPVSIPVAGMANAMMGAKKKRAKAGRGCHRKRMGAAGTRCFCGGKLSKTSRCKR